MKRASSILWGIAMIGSCLLAGPASPDGITIHQPDGSVIQARILGDEFQGWIETQDGYTIVNNSNTGVWEYGTRDPLSGEVHPSGQTVHPGSPAPSFLERHLQPARNLSNEAIQSQALQQTQQQRSGAFLASPMGSSLPQAAPLSGTRKLLVILVNFTDRTLTTTPSGWNTTLFQTGAGIKSVRQFYADNSFNTLDVVPVPHTQAGNPAGVVSVTIAIPHPNYGNSFVYATETAWLNLALAQAAAYVDFAALDSNGNGQISTDEAVFYFIPAGYETSGTAKTPSIWAHAWGGGITAGTKTITHWAMNGELNDANRQHPMGVIAHELGHAMGGLPDLYDTTYTNQGLGAFSLMSSGSWGADNSEDSGTTPVSLDAWCRQSLGWTSLQSPSTSGQLVTLGTCLSGSSAGAKLQNAALSTQEYFLVENRYPSGWDRGLINFFGGSWPGGLLVMHLDGTISSNAYVSGNHQMLMAEHANNAAYGSFGSGASLFYNGNNSSFTPTSSPASSFYSGASSGVGLTSASSPGATMTFNLVKNQNPTIATITNKTIQANSISAAIPFTVGDAETAAASLSLVATSSNSALLPVANIVFSGSGANRTVTFTPAANQAGTSNVSIQVTDGDGASSSTTFTVTVNAQPTITPITNLTINKNASSPVIPITLTDAETSPASLSLVGTSSNIVLIPIANIVFGGSGANRTVTITPAANQYGTGNVRVRVNDPDGGTSSTLFTVTVPVGNTNPTITTITDQSLIKNTPLTIPFTIGDGQTPAASLSLVGTISNAVLTPLANVVFGGTGANRTVTITPAANQTGTGMVRVRVNDPDGGTNSTLFNVTVFAANTNPTITTITNQTLAMNTPITIPFTIGDAETAVTSLSLVGTISNAVLTPLANVVFGGSGANRTVTITPAANQTGTGMVRVRVNDPNGGTTSTLFSVTVN